MGENESKGSNRQRWRIKDDVNGGEGKRKKR